MHKLLFKKNDLINKETEYFQIFSSHIFGTDYPYS